MLFSWTDLCYTNGVNALKATVKNGHLVVDEPTDLPEGTELYLVPANGDDADGLGPAERAQLHAEIEASINERKAGGQAYSAEDVLAELGSGR